MRIAQRLAALVVCTTLACSTLVASARPASTDRKKTDAVREHVRRGSAFYNVGKYAEAAVEFEEAYAARPEPGLLYNAAQAARMGGDLRKAQTLYSTYVSFHPDGPNVGDAKGHLEKIEAQLKAEEAQKRPAEAQAQKPAPAPVVVEPEPAPVAPPPAQRAERPVYKKWWFWTAIVGGAAVVATGITLGVVYGRPRPSWDDAPPIGPGAPATMPAALPAALTGGLHIRF